MKRIYKSYLALLLSFLFLSFSSISSYAISNDNTVIQKKLLSTSIMNEYQKIKELQSCSDEELLKKGFSKTEIKEIKDFNYAKEIVKRAKLGMDDLKSLGYNDEQVNILKRYASSDIQSETLSEVQLNILSSTCTLNVWEYGHFYSSSKSEVYLESDWDWGNIPPVFTGTDIVAISWSDGLYPQINSQQVYSTYCDVNYYFAGALGKVSWITKDTLTVIGDTNLGAYAKIPMLKNVTQSGATITTYAMDGRLQVYISKQAAVLEISVSSQYGHSTITVSPTVQFKGAPSITFGVTMTTEAADSVYINIKKPY